MGLFKTSSIEKKYTVDKKELGSGNFAVVKKGTVKKGVKETDLPAGLKEGNEVAVKIIDKAKVPLLALNATCMPRARSAHAHTRARP